MSKVPLTGSEVPETIRLLYYLCLKGEGRLDGVDDPMTYICYAMWLDESFDDLQLTGKDYAFPQWVVCKMIKGEWPKGDDHDSNP